MARKKAYKTPGYKRVESGRAVDKKIQSMDLTVINGGRGDDPGKTKKVTVVDNTAVTETHEALVRKLRAAEHTIEACIRGIGEHYHTAGQALLTVREDKLYQADGFRGFNAWLDSRKYTKTRQTAYNLIAVAENLTVEEAGKLAPTVGYIVARAPDREARRELLALVGRGATTRQIAETAKSQRADRGIESRSPGRPKKEVKRAVGRPNGGHSEHAPNGGKTEVVEKSEVNKTVAKRGREEAGLESGTSCILSLKPAPAGSKKSGYDRKAIGQLGENGPRLAVWVGKDSVKIKVL